MPRRRRRSEHNHRDSPRASLPLALPDDGAGSAPSSSPLWRGWRETTSTANSSPSRTRSTGHKLALLPGTIAVGATGVFLAADAEYNFFTTGWLLALEICYLFMLFVCVPLLGHALNRVQIEALKSKKRGKPTDELQGSSTTTSPSSCACSSSSSSPSWSGCRNSSPSDAGRHIQCHHALARLSPRDCNAERRLRNAFPRAILRLFSARDRS